MKYGYLQISVDKRLNASNPDTDWPTATRPRANKQTVGNSFKKKKNAIVFNNAVPACRMDWHG